MKRGILTAVLVLGWPLAGAALAQSVDEVEREKIQTPDVPDTSGKRPDLARAAELIAEKTNAFRKQEGRGPVTADWGRSEPDRGRKRHRGWVPASDQRTQGPPGLTRGTRCATGPCDPGGSPCKFKFTPTTTSGGATS